VVGISYDSLEILKRFASSKAIAFPLLSDPGSQVIDAYGIRNLESKGSRVDGIPYPMTFVIDAKGTIRAKLGHDGYKIRHTSEDLVKAVAELKK
jgi:peroxiredoxin Q/BCP